MKTESAELRNAAHNYGQSALHDGTDEDEAAASAAWVRLHNAAIDYVAMRLTDGPADSARFSGDRTAWLKFVQANPNAFAAMLEDLKYLKRG